LLLVVLAAIVDLAWFRIAVSGRTTFDGIEDVDIWALEFARFDHFRQQLSSFANEWSSTAIFLGTGALPEKCEPGRHTSFAENGLLSAASQHLTSSAHRDNLLKPIERQLTLGRWDRFPGVGTFQ
jgi:hypothetical protein